ncbi:hypothetical protein SIIN_5334_T, partial [Serendipita indica DSM 11827]
MECRDGRTAGPALKDTMRTTSLSFSPDGHKIVSGSWDKTVRYGMQRRANRLDPRSRTYQCGLVCRLLARRSQDRFWIQDKTVQVWNAETGEPLGPALEDIPMRSPLLPSRQTVTRSFLDPETRQC